MSMNKRIVKNMCCLALVFSSLVSSSCGKDVTNNNQPFYDPNQANNYDQTIDNPSDLAKGAVDGVRPRVVIKNMFYRVNKEVGANVEDLFGELVSKVPTNPVNFDVPSSFSVLVHQAKLYLDGVNMDNLMKDYVLNYPDAPLSELKNSIEPGGRMTIKGKMKQAGIKIPFEMSGMIHATPEGLMELVPDSIKTAGIPAKGLLDFLGLETQKLINVNEQRGMKIVGNAIVLDPSKLFPPPTMNGKIIRVETDTNKLTLYFDDKVQMARPPLPVIDDSIKNYQHVYGGAVRLVGNEIHENTNLLMVDMNQTNPFDFCISEYYNQLMAGQVNLLNRTGALINYLADYNDVPKRLNRRQLFNPNSIDANLGPVYQQNPNSNPALTKQQNWANQPKPVIIK